LLVWSERTTAILYQIKTFDFSKTIIRQAIPDGYNESKEQMKSILIQGKG
jgi:hypothetical protein